MTRMIGAKKAAKMTSAAFANTNSIRQPYHDAMSQPIGRRRVAARGRR
jgi:hypothetical protein